MKRSFGLALAVVAALSIAKPAIAAVDGYLKIDGIDGESQDDKHKDWIEISSFNAPITIGSGNIGGGAGRSTGRPNVHEVTISKRMDAASPKLYEALHNGTHIPKVIIELARPSGKSPMVYELTDVTLSNYSKSAGAQPTETFSLNFTKIEYQYTTQKADTAQISNGGQHGVMTPRASHLPPPGDGN